ncbi:MAG: DUF6390 family protein [Patescibacteria group bacterium]
MKNNFLVSAKYAFRPNKLNFCGPDKNKELGEYLQAGFSDGGAEEILKNFECLFPYLDYIARMGKTADPFLPVVGEAYWVGNDLLGRSGGKDFYSHLATNFAIEKKFKTEELGVLKEKIRAGANAHHSFHVFNVWQNPSQAENPHVLYQMDECRIGWGEVKLVEDKIIKVLYEPIIFEKGKLMFGQLVLKDIFYEFKDTDVKIGDWVSFHWSSFCEVLSIKDLENLKKWTTINLHLANL